MIAAIQVSGSPALTLVIGLYLGRLPWRYRQQILQLQGAVLGGAVGFVIGRLSKP